MKKLYLLSLIFVAATSFAQTWNARFLVPLVAQEQAGGHGSVWSTRMWAYNAGTEGVILYPTSLCKTAMCTIFTPVSAGRPGEIEFLRVLPGTPPGQILYADSTEELDVFLSLRVRDESRNAASMGVQIPVIRDSELFETPISLPGVPGDLRFRHTLRIYDIANEPSSFRVKVLDDLGRILVEETVTLTVNPGTADATGLDFGPSAAQLDFRNRIPLDEGAYAVTVEPLQESRFWAFLSVTNNETQEVTLVIPNPS